MRRDGSAVSVQLAVDAAVGPDGTVVGRIAVVREREAVHVAQLALAHEQDFVGRILRAVGALMVVLDMDGRVVHFNEACEELTGIRAADIKGKLLWPQVVPPHDTGRVLAEFHALTSGAYPSSMESSWRAASGGTRLIAWTNTAVTDVDGSLQYVVGAGIDVTEERQRSSDLKEAAATDSLTGIPNRAGLISAVERQLVADRSAGLLFLDIDRFKDVNDTHGHSAGDDLLVAVVHRIRRCVRHGDVVARLGGDEFVVMCPDISDLESAALAERLDLELRAPLHLACGRVVTSCSVGHARLQSGEPLEAALERADKSMYQRKRTRTGRARATSASVSPPD